MANMAGDLPYALETFDPTLSHSILLFSGPSRSHTLFLLYLLSIDPNLDNLLG